MSCRRARALVPALGRAGASLPEAERRRVEAHLAGCRRCAAEARLARLGRAALDLAAGDPGAPDENFFRQLRARLEREAAAPAVEDTWALDVLVTARQFLPAMAVLLLLIIGATVLWSGAAEKPAATALRPSERVLFNVDYWNGNPTSDDVLETLIAVEEKEKEIQKELKKNNAK